MLNLYKYIFILVCICITSNSYAVTLRFDYKGVIETLITPSSISDISIGDAVDGYFLINTDINFTTVDQSINSLYFTALGDQSHFVDGFLTTGSHSFDSTNYGTRSQQVVSVIDSGLNDHYRLTTEGLINSNEIVSMKLDFGGEGRLTLNNTNLEQNFIWDASIDPDPLNSVSSVSYTSFFGTVDLDIGAKLTFAQLSIASPVPVPGTVWLMGTALFGLIGFSRKKTLTTI